MLKKLFVTAALVGVTAYSYGQGQVNFDTKAVNAKILNSTGAAAAGTAYFAQLYAAAGVDAPSATLAPVGNKVNLRSGVNAGFVQVSGTVGGVDVVPVVTVPTAGPGGASTVQLRAWSSSVANYSDAQTTPGAEWGSSASLNLSATGNPDGQPPTTPVDLAGLQGFTMTLNPIPEPSTIALGVLGAAALAFARRRK